MMISAKRIELYLDDNEAELIAYALHREMLHSIDTHWKRVGLAGWEKDHAAQSKLSMMRRLLQVVGQGDAAQGYINDFRKRIVGEEAA